MSDLETTAESSTSERYRLLYDLGCAFAARLEMRDLIASIIERCRRILRAEGVAILVCDEATNELRFPYVTESEPAAAARLADVRFPADRGIAGDVLRSGRAELVEDAGADPRFYGEIDRTSGMKTRSMLVAPLHAAGRPIGVIEVMNRVAGEPPFSVEDLGFLEALAGSIATALENARLYEELKAREEKLRLDVGVLRRDLAHRDRFSGIVGNSAAMNGVFRLMESAAASPIAVLIEGETGTGKELVARGIHRASDRAEKAFLALNCAALPATLLESELFGHSRGAFTGADRDRQGAFEAADGGTIFLDEIGEMPLEMQAKLLRVLQEGEVTPVGSHRARKVDVRVVSATNKDLKRSADGGSFRADLYYRVSAFPIRVPPLRERAEDIPLLVEHLLGAAAKRHGKRIAGIERAVVDRIAAFAWPGNVRELENEIERAVALTPPGEPLRVEVLSEKLVGIVARAADGEDRPGEAPRTDGTAEVTPLEDARSQFETRYIREALKQFGGNVSHTAKRLGISRVTLQKKMKEYDLR